MTSPEARPITLTAGRARVELRPDLGAAISGFWLDDVPVLRSTPAVSLARVREAGCFALVPYSNRIGYAQFRWQGRDLRTTPNFTDAQPGYPHSIHGCAWRKPWRVISATDRVAELALSHASDAHWPFSFEVVQRVELGEQGLRVALHLTNQDDGVQPVGLGFHPYFPKRSRSRIHVECSHRWESDPVSHLPTRRVPQAGIDGEVRHLDFDHCFEGWRGAAHLRDEKLHVAVSGSSPYLVVYTPPTRDYFCVEPVSHVNNAIHMADPLAHGMVAVPAGGTVQAWMQIDVSAV